MLAGITMVVIIFWFSMLPIEEIGITFRESAYQKGYLDGHNAAKVECDSLTLNLRNEQRETIL